LGRLAVLFASVGYLGFIPAAPGTWGSAAGLLLVYVLRALAMPGAEILAIVVITGVGTWAAGRAERELHLKDPGPVVVDEVVGMLITLALVPWSVPAAIAGFVIFRAYDVVKPFPAGRLEGAPGGWGVMLDDVVAGLYANVTLRAGLALVGAAAS
jgi:phosphatidylglycerophosphatase A